jgi:hypothetical protein
MGNIFRPGDPKYGRTIQVITAYSCTFVGVHSIMMDYGKHEHVFTPIQTYMHRKIDNYFQLTDEELSIPPTTVEKPTEEPKPSRKKATSPASSNG